MREFEPTMASQVDIFLGQLLHASKGQQVVEMTSRCRWLAMDIIGLLAFGCAWNTQTEETLRLIPAAFATLNPLVYLFMNWPKVHKIDPGVQWLVRGRVENFRRILAGIISDRMALPRDAKHDLFSFVASDERIDQAQQEGIRKSEIWGEAGVFVNAGKFPQDLLLATGTNNPSAQRWHYNSDGHVHRLLLPLAKPICLRQARLRS